MTTQPRPWAKWYNSDSDDKRLAHIARTTGYHRMTIVGCWATILSLANQYPAGSAVLLTREVPHTSNTIAIILGLDAGSTDYILTQMLDLGLLQKAGTPWAYHVVDWEKRT